MSILWNSVPWKNNSPVDIWSFLKWFLNLGVKWSVPNTQHGMLPCSQQWHDGPPRRDYWKKKAQKCRCGPRVFTTRSRLVYIKAAVSILLSALLLADIDYTHLPRNDPGSVWGWGVEKAIAHAAVTCAVGHTSVWRACQWARRRDDWNQMKLRSLH